MMALYTGEKQVPIYAFTLMIILIQYVNMLNDVDASKCVPGNVVYD